MPRHVELAPCLVEPSEGAVVSLLSDSGVRIEDIADLCGHAGTTVTAKVYRHPLHAVSHSGTRRGHIHRWDMPSDLVGTAGFEPTTP